jgi:hypothetical protein
MIDRHELWRVRAAGLSPFDIKVLSTFMETGGEFPFYVDRLRPEMRDIQIAGMNALIARDIVEVDTTRSNGHRWMLRLTDNGRALCAELEKMSAKRPIEVQMQGGTPEVIKSP